jgi:hypothetical protein
MTLDLHAPDGTNQPVNTQTVQHLGTLLPFSTAVIFAGGQASWEQAGVVYINDVRQPTLIGSHHHPKMFSLGERTFSQHIMVAGWHKQSPPAGGRPWVASRGRLQAGVAGWDDSGGDADFEDLTARIHRLTGTLQILSSVTSARPTLRSLDESPFWDAARPTARSLEESPSRDAALVLTSVANLKALVAQMPEGADKEALARFTEEAFSNIVANYYANVTETESRSAPLSPSIVLAADLNLIAQSFQEGNLRAALLEQVALILQGVDASTGYVSQ